MRMRHDNICSSDAAAPAAADRRPTTADPGRRVATRQIYLAHPLGPWAGPQGRQSAVRPSGGESRDDDAPKDLDELKETGDSLASVETDSKRGSERGSGSAPSILIANSARSLGVRSPES
eukprot:scaffold282407_cov19-Tisochrysis_lutea.AAC.1